MDEKNQVILNEYIDNISDFYNMATEWLKEKSLSYKKVNHNINETKSGKYTVEKLIIYKNKTEKIAEICPIGAWIIGANGRIDLIGDFDQQILIYLKKDLKIKTSISISTDEDEYEVSKNTYSLYKGVDRNGWYWIENKQLGKTYAINKELFFDLLAEVSDYEF